MLAKIKTPGTMALLATVLMASPAFILPAEAERPTALKSFLDCRPIADNMLRLACFDAAVEAAAPRPPKTPKEETQAVEESFGHEALPVARQEEKQKSQEYRAKVAVFSSDAYGNLILVLENGQVWGQTDGLQTQLLTGEQWVTIHRAALGSYLITIESVHRTYRFKRIK